MGSKFGVSDNVARFRNGPADGPSLTKEERDFERRSEEYFAACDRFEVAKKEKKTAELRLDVAAFALGKKVYRSKRVVLIQAGDYPGQLPMNPAYRLIADPAAAQRTPSPYLHCGTPALGYLRRTRDGSVVRVHCCQKCGYELTLTLKVVQTP